VIRSHRCLTILEVAEGAGISKAALYEIPPENLGMHRVAAKYVPRPLSADRK
jgi:hypothetical protein